MSIILAFTWSRRVGEGTREPKGRRIPLVWISATPWEIRRSRHPSRRLPTTSRVSGMQRLAMFDLDNTLLDRDAAFSRWLDEFVHDHRLDSAAHAWLLRADSLRTGSMDAFFHHLGEKFSLASPVDDLW